MQSRAALLDNGNFLPRQILITRRIEFVARGQIHPQLDTVQRAAPLCEFFFMIFRMDNAARRCHPLHVAGSDYTAIAGGIVMLHRAFEHDGDGLKTTVGMGIQSAAAPRHDLRRPKIIQHEEGIERVQFRSGKGPHDVQPRRGFGRITRDDFCNLACAWREVGHGGSLKLKRRYRDTDLLENTARCAAGNGVGTDLGDQIAGHLIEKIMRWDLHFFPCRSHGTKTGQRQRAGVVSTLIPAHGDNAVTANFDWVVLVMPIGKARVKRPDEGDELRLGHGFDRRHKTHFLCDSTRDLLDVVGFEPFYVAQDHRWNGVCHGASLYLGRIEEWLSVSF